MYEALTGRTPFEGQSPIDTLMMHINNPVPPFEVVVPELNIHPDLEAIVVKALEKDVTKRYQTMKEMERAVRALKLDAPPGSLGTALGPDSPDSGQFEICPKCAKQKRPAQEGSITSWLRADSTCMCEPQTNVAQPNQAEQPVNAAEQNHQQNDAPSTNTDNRYNRFAQDRGQVQQAPAAPPGRNTNALILICAGIAFCVPVALFFIFRPGVNSSSTAQPPAQTAPAAAQTIQTSPVSQATPMIAPTQPTIGPTSTTSTLGPQSQATTQNTVAQHPSTGPSPTPPGNEQHPGKMPRPAANKNSNETKANSKTHPIKKAKKHHVAADGSSPVKPLDDMDRWQQFQSGQ
jgi:serine/threonine protein kinase